MISLNKNLKRIVLVMAVVLSTLCTIKAYASETINGHKLLAENEKYKLYLYEEMLSLIIEDKETGSIMESTILEYDESSNEYWNNFMQSGVVLEVIEDVTTISKVVGLREAKIDLTKNDNGFVADIYYEKYGFYYTIEVTLEDEGIVVYIPDESIREEEELYKIANIYIYPFMGHTKLGEREGYMLIPDGNGAIINLDDKEGRFSTGFSKRVYGTNVGLTESYVLSLLNGKYQTINDAELILAPVYGMIHTDSKMAYLAIIEEGTFDATIEAYPNGAYTSYNWITSKFRQRQVYVQPTSRSGGSFTKVENDRTHSNIKVKFIFTNNDEADYVGLANKYRDYLLDNDEVVVQDNEFKIRLDFLGADIKKWFVFNMPVAMTTVEQLEEILLDLESEGVNNVLAIYRGWQKDGINNLPITSYKVEGKLGSKRSLSNLIENMASKGIDIFLYNDGIRANPDLTNTTYNVVKKIDKRLYEESTYKDVFEKMVFLTASKSSDNLSKLTSSYLKNDIKNIALSGISNNLYSYTYRSNSYSRVDTANTFEGAVANINENMNIALDEPFSYLWKYTDALYNIPVVSSKYILVDEDIPFLSIALKGVVPMYGDYINFEADKKEYFLKLIETGILPSFYLTYEDTQELMNTNSNDIYSAKYDVYKDTVVEYYKELKEVNDKIQGSFIVGHEKTNNVAIITYSNDVQIYINYNEEDVVVNGTNISPLSYKVGDVNE